MTDTKRQLPPVPNSNHLRKQAKSRLAALRMRAPSARLAQAQHLIAREYGFANWREMQVEVALRQESPASLYGRIRRHPLAVPGRNEDEGEPPITPHFLSAGASTAILFVMGGVGAWLMVLVGRARTDELYGLHHALALLHKIL